MEEQRLSTVQEGHSYVLLGENGHDFGSTMKRHAAIGAAKAIAAGPNTRVAIGRLKSNITWH